VERLLWRRLRRVEDIDFHEGLETLSVGNGVSKERLGRKIDRTELAAMEWEMVPNKESIRAVATQSLRYKALGISNIPSLTEKSVQLIEVVSLASLF
jgi:hypothetical protein